MVRSIIQGWKPPNNCLECPFFKVNVANAGYGSSLICLITKEVFEIANVGFLRENRSQKCPIKEIKK